MRMGTRRVGGMMLRRTWEMVKVKPNQGYHRRAEPSLSLPGLNKVTKRAQHRIASTDQPATNTVYPVCELN